MKNRALQNAQQAFNAHESWVSAMQVCLYRHQERAAETTISLS